MSRRNVGMVADPHDPGALVPVRINSAGQYYYLSRVAQPVRMRVREGDRWIEANAVLWGDGAPPADCPDWIAADKSEPPRERRPVGRPRKNPPPPAAPDAPPSDTAAMQPVPVPAAADDEVSFL